MHRIVVASFTLLAAAGLGCGADPIRSQPSGASCSSGAIQDCQCADGRDGKRVCDDGRWHSCWCGATDAGTSTDAAVWPDMGVHPDAAAPVDGAVAPDGTVFPIDSTVPDPDSGLHPDATPVLPDAVVPPVDGGVDASFPDALPGPDSGVGWPDALPGPDSGVGWPDALPAPDSGVGLPDALPAPDSGVGFPDALPLPDSGVDASFPDAMPAPDSGVGWPDALPPDLGPPPDVGVLDTGVADAGSLDASGGLGVYLGPPTNNLIGVTPNEDEILVFDSSDALASISPQTGAKRVITTQAALVYQPPIVWMFSNVSAAGMSGDLQTYRPGAAGVTTVAQNSAFRLLWRTEDAEWAIATENFREVGFGTTSTRTADLILINADGTTKRTLLTGINVGQFDAQSRTFVGPCSSTATFTSGTTAMAVVCTDGVDERRKLLTIDRTTGATRVVVTGLLPILFRPQSPAFMLFVDESIALFGTDLAGTTVVPLVEVDPLVSFRFLDGARFAYTTDRNQLKVASWPRMIPTVVLAFSAGLLRAASPTGQHVMFSETRDDLSNLFLIETTTQTARSPVVLSATRDAYKGDDAFSEDGAYVYWYANSAQNFIGTIMSMPAAGTSIPTTLTPQGYYVRNYADLTSVMLMTNASVVTNTVIADLAVRPRDASGPLQVLATGVDALDYVIFPGRTRIVYEIPSGPSAGTYVRSLP